MTDKELIDLIEMKLPHELTPDEVELIRQRLAESAELRQALSGRILIDQYLSDAIGQVQLPIDDLYARATQSRRQRRLANRLWGIGLLLFAGLAVGGWYGRVWIEQQLALNEAVDPPAPKADNSGVEIAAHDPQDHSDNSTPPDRVGGVALPADGMANVVSPNSSPFDEAAKAAAMHGKTAVSPKSTAIAIEIEAESFVRGNVVTSRKRDDPRLTMIQSQDKEEHTFAEYEIDSPRAGKFTLAMRYTADKPRPLTVTINGKKVTEKAAAADRNDVTAKGFKWSEEGTIELVEGKNIIRLENWRKSDWRKWYFPYIDKLAFKEQLSDGTTPARPEIIAANAKPWDELTHLGGPPRPFAELAMESIDRTLEPPTTSEMTSWFGYFEPYQFSRQRVDAEKTDLVRLAGTMRLRAPFVDGTVLRMSLYEQAGLKLHFWRGQQGLTLQHYPDTRQAWVAYRTTRKANEPQPTSFVFADSDEDLNWRTTTTMPVRFDLHYGQGLITLSRGEIVLLQVPFEGEPEAIYFDGRPLIRSWSLVRASGSPPKKHHSTTPLLTIDQPAKLEWKGELTGGVQLLKMDDGAVELATEKGQPTAFSSFELPKLGLYQMVVELDELTPGTRLFLARDDGRPQYGLGFFRENTRRALSMTFIHPFDGRADVDINIIGQPSPAIEKRTWVKLLYGAGVLKCWLSADGVHWGRPVEPLGNLEGNYTRLGLMVHGAGDARRSIRLRRVTLHPLEELMKLVPEDLVAKARPVVANNLAEWVAAADKQQPTGVNNAQWHMACAIKTLGGGTSRSLGNALVDGLLDHGLLTAETTSDRLKLLNDAALVLDHFSDESDYLRFLRRYELLGRQLVRAEDSQPWSQVARGFYTAPIWMRSGNRAHFDELTRAELLNAVYHNRYDDLRQSIAAVRLYGVRTPLLSWAESRLALRGENNPDGLPAAMASDRRHPLIEELSKEGFSVLAEFESALASKAYRDACQIINSAGSSEALGLLPDSQDPQLLVSLLNAVGLAMQNEPTLRSTMISEFGPLGMLRVRQAIADSDINAVAAATVQLFGTDAAAEAHLWLGDRSLSLGEFAKALAHYQQVSQHGSAAFEPRAAPRIRLAAAMMGQNAGQPANTMVELGESRIAVADFESLVQEMRARNAKAALGSTASEQRLFAVPPPNALRLKEIAKLDGDIGDKPNELPENVREGQIDWAARQLGVTTAGNQLLVNNRFQLASYELPSGQRKWRVELGGEHGRAHEQSLIAMRPIVTDDRILVRRVGRSGPELAAFQLSDGKLLWRGKAVNSIISDPVVVQNELLALTVARSEQLHSVMLTTFDMQNGAILSQRPLLSLRALWEQHRTCELILSGDRLYGILPGVVFSCDVGGKMRWARRQQWLSTDEDRNWARHAMQPPILEGQSLFVAQPGVKALECIDSESGKLVWRKVVPGIRRVIGLLDERVVLQTDEGLQAVSTKDGQSIWHHEAANLMDTSLVGRPGGIVYARVDRKRDPKQLFPTLVWLEPATGKPLKQTSLSGLQHERPMLGPWILAPDRIWVFAGGGSEDGSRILFDVLAVGPASPFEP